MFGLPFADCPRLECLVGMVSSRVPLTSLGSLCMRSSEFLESLCLKLSISRFKFALACSSLDLPSVNSSTLALSIYLGVRNSNAMN